MKITIYTRNVYGQQLIYPVGDGADAVCRLTHKKTLDEYDIAALKDLGHETAQVPDPKSLII